MASPTQSQRVFRSLLFDQTLASGGSGIASGAEGDLTVEADGDLVLNSGEWAEITSIEQFPFMKADGSADQMEHIIPKIDNILYRGGSIMRLRSDLDSLFTVPYDLSMNELSVGVLGTRKTFRMGWGLPELMDMGIDKNPNLIMNNSTLKVKEKGTITFHYKAGATVGVGANETMRVRAFGYRYSDMSVADFYVNGVYHPERNGLPIVLQDKKTGRQFSTSVGVSYASARKDWSKLLGGNDMHLNGGIQVDYFNYWARNKGATTASKDFDLSFGQTQVAETAQDMGPQIDDKTLYYITNLGCLDYSGNLRYIFIKANNNIVFQQRLDSIGTQTVNNAVNSQRFGRVTNTGANVTIADHRFRPIPYIDPIFGHNETLKVTIRDNGTSIGDGTNIFNGALMVWAGFIIQDKNLVVEVPNKITGNIGGGKALGVG